MVTIIKITQLSIGGCNLQNCFVDPNGLTDLTEILNLYLWSKDSQHTNETSILSNWTGHL